MSSYLSIFIKPKDADNKICIATFCRSSDIYQFFYENNLSVYAYDSLNTDAAVRFRELTKDEFKDAIHGLQHEINEDEKKYLFEERHSKTTEDVMELYSTRKYIDEKIELLHTLGFLEYIFEEIEYGNIEGVFINHD